MADDAPIQDQTDNLTEASGIPPGNRRSRQARTSEDLPERLRVHSLARVLGTTSRRVLDALSELDGRTRSAHSSVDRTDAVRVRDVLAQATAGSTEPAEAPALPVPVTRQPKWWWSSRASRRSAEPESRLLLETPRARRGGPRGRVTPADYLPLFVAPQPVAARPAVRDDDAEDERRRRRGRRRDDAEDADDDEPSRRQRRRPVRPARQPPPPAGPPWSWPRPGR